MQSPWKVSWLHMLPAIQGAFSSFMCVGVDVVTLPAAVMLFAVQVVVRRL